MQKKKCLRTRDTNIHVPCNYMLYQLVNFYGRLERIYCLPFYNELIQTLDTALCYMRVEYLTIPLWNLQISHCKKQVSFVELLSFGTKRKSLICEQNNYLQQFYLSLLRAFWNLYRSLINKCAVYETWKSLKFTLKYTQISLIHVSVYDHHQGACTVPG